MLYARYAHIFNSTYNPNSLAHSVYIGGGTNKTTTPAPVTSQSTTNQAVVQAAQAALPQTATLQSPATFIQSTFAQSQATSNLAALPQSAVLQTPAIAALSTPKLEGDVFNLRPKLTRPTADNTFTNFSYTKSTADFDNDDLPDIVLFTLSSGMSSSSSNSLTKTGFSEAGFNNLVAKAPNQYLFSERTSLKLLSTDDRPSGSSILSSSELNQLAQPSLLSTQRQDMISELQTKLKEAQKLDLSSRKPSSSIRFEGKKSSLQEMIESSQQKAAVSNQPSLQDQLEEASEKRKAQQKAQQEAQQRAAQTAQTARSEQSQDPALSAAQQRQLQALQSRDIAVKAHEMAHAAAAAGLSGVPTYTYQTGPNGERFAIGGQVNIDMSPGRTPEETLTKASRILAAATAPSDPSSADNSVAMQASRMASIARSQIMTSDQQTPEIKSQPIGLASQNNIENSVGFSPSEEAKLLTSDQMVLSLAATDASPRDSDLRDPIEELLVGQVGPSDLNFIQSVELQDIAYRDLSAQKAAEINVETKVSGLDDPRIPIERVADSDLTAEHRKEFPPVPSLEPQTTFERTEAFGVEMSQAQESTSPSEFSELSTLDERGADQFREEVSERIQQPLQRDLDALRQLEQELRSRTEQQNGTQMSTDNPSTNSSAESLTNTEPSVAVENLQETQKSADAFTAQQAVELKESPQTLNSELSADRLIDDRQETSGFLETGSEPGSADNQSPELIGQFSSERSLSSVSGVLTAEEQLNTQQEQQLESSMEREDLSGLNNDARAEDLSSSVGDQTTVPKSNSEIQTPLSKIDPATRPTPTQQSTLQENANTNIPGTISQAADSLSRPNNQQNISVLTGAEQSTPGFSLKMARAEQPLTAQENKFGKSGRAMSTQDTNNPMLNSDPINPVNAQNQTSPTIVNTTASTASQYGAPITPQQRMQRSFVAVYEKLREMLERVSPTSSFETVA